ncbi:MAG: hypothetical protein AAF942_11000 [Pseudomonadota bacterium]
MNKLTLALKTLLSLSLAATWSCALADERDARQAELDAACEAARQKKIVVERAKYVDECVETGMRADRAACERFYADYGANTAGRAPLYYDLPECVAAHEYRRSYRRSGN